MHIFTRMLLEWLIKTGSGERNVTSFQYGMDDTKWAAVEGGVYCLKMRFQNNKASQIKVSICSDWRYNDRRF
ncbi:hypothetical protein [Sporosarcina sp.]|uniref:hypothetical protein n=1 Tax=Sporosarcina sp. TaxID=49982 RepID=UPI002610F181|nr:hypothetical protein [Sporosarcina sp.]